MRVDPLEKETRGMMLVATLVKWIVGSLMFGFVHYKTLVWNHPLHWKIVSGISTAACLFMVWRSYGAL